MFSLVVTPPIIFEPFFFCFLVPDSLGKLDLFAQVFNPVKILSTSGWKFPRVVLVGLIVVLLCLIDVVVASIVDVTCEFHSEVVLPVVVVHAEDSSNDVVSSIEFVVVVMDVVIGSSVIEDVVVVDDVGVSDVVEVVVVIIVSVNVLVEVVDVAVVEDVVVGVVRVLVAVIVVVLEVVVVVGA